MKKMARSFEEEDEELLYLRITGLLIIGKKKKDNVIDMDIKRLRLAYWGKPGVSSHIPWKYVIESLQTAKMISNINYYYCC